MSLFQNVGALIHHRTLPVGHGGTALTSHSEIHTQEQKNIAIIKAVAIAILTGTMVATSTPFGGLIAFVAGSAYSSWTIYSNIIKSDPLIEAFYTICGGKDQFNKLPTIQLTKKRTFDAIRKLSWDGLPAISKANTSDGRTIVIVKGLQTEGHLQNRDIFAFVEKLGPNDFSRAKIRIPESIYSIFSTLFWLFWPTASQKEVVEDFELTAPVYRKTLLEDIEEDEIKIETKTIDKKIVMTSFITAKMNHDFRKRVNSFTILKAITP